MTALYEAPAQPSAQERHGTSRRRVLQIFALGSGAAAVSIATGGFLLSREGDKSTPPTTAGQGGQAGTESLAPTRSNERPINPTNIEHIQQVLQGTPQLEKKVVAFMGGGFRYIVGRSTDGIHPWLQLTTPKSEHLTFSLRPVGLIPGGVEPLPTWAEAQKKPIFNPDEWEDFAEAEGTKIKFNNAYDHLPMAGVTGWTNIGTPEERHFSLQSNRVERLGALSVAQRKTEFIALTGALFDARAFG